MTSELLALRAVHSETVTRLTALLHDERREHAEEIRRLKAELEALRAEETTR